MRRSCSNRLSGRKQILFDKPKESWFRLRSYIWYSSFDPALLKCIVSFPAILRVMDDPQKVGSRPVILSAPGQDTLHHKPVFLIFMICRAGGHASRFSPLSICGDPAKTPSLGFIAPFCFLCGTDEPPQNPSLVLACDVISDGRA